MVVSCSIVRIAWCIVRQKNLGMIADHQNTALAIDIEPIENIHCFSTKLFYVLVA